MKEQRFGVTSQGTPQAMKADVHVLTLPPRLFPAHCRWRDGNARTIRHPDPPVDAAGRGTYVCLGIPPPARGAAA